MHNVIALGEIIDLQEKLPSINFPLHCYQKIDLEKKTCQPSSFSFTIIYNVKKLIYKRKHADHHHLHFIIIYKILNVIIFINFWLICHIWHQLAIRYLLIFSVPLLLSLTAQCGFEAHKTNAVTSSPPSPTCQSPALGKIFEFTQKDSLRQKIHQYINNHQLFSIFFNIFTC
jgi:hypothetical protein